MHENMLNARSLSNRLIRITKSNDCHSVVSNKQWYTVGTVDLYLKGRIEIFRMNALTKHFSRESKYNIFFLICIVIRQMKEGKEEKRNRPTKIEYSWYNWLWILIKTIHSNQSNRIDDLSIQNRKKKKKKMKFFRSFQSVVHSLRNS